MAKKKLLTEAFQRYNYPWPFEKKKATSFHTGHLYRLCKLSHCGKTEPF